MSSERKRLFSSLYFLVCPTEGSARTIRVFSQLRGRRRTRFSSVLQPWMSRNIIAAGDGAVAAPPAALSKRARKRLAKAEAFREKKRLKKERKKEARSLLAQHRQAGAPNAATAGLSPPLTASANPAFGNQ